MKRLLALTCAMALAVTACTGSSEDTEVSSGPVTTASVTTTDIAPPATATTTTGTIAPPETTTTTEPQQVEGIPAVYRQPRAVGAFAPFEEIPLLDDAVAYAGPATPTTADDLLIAGLIRWEMDGNPGLVATLLDNGFVVDDQGYRHFHEAYSVGIYEDVPLFVTTDAAYHVWHLAFSKVLREAEQQALLPVLEELVTGLAGAARAQDDFLSETALADASQRTVMWFEAAIDLLELGSANLQGAVDEVELAQAAIEMTRSPITSFGECNILVSPSGCVDYSLFKPRGHYTRSADLERYFRAMSALRV